MAAYRALELKKMWANFFGPDPAYHKARQRFIYKGAPIPQVAGANAMISIFSRLNKEVAFWVVIWRFLRGLDHYGLNFCLSDATANAPTKPLLHTLVISRSRLKNLRWPCHPQEMGSGENQACVVATEQGSGTKLGSPSHGPDLAPCSQRTDTDLNWFAWVFRSALIGLVVVFLTT